MDRSHERWVAGAGDDPIWVYDQPGPSENAPAVILVHGAGGDGPSPWTPSYAQLANHFRCVSLDLRGNGEGPARPDSGWRTARTTSPPWPTVSGSRAAASSDTAWAGLWHRWSGSATRPRLGLVLAATAPIFGRSRRGRVLQAIAPVLQTVLRRPTEWVKARLTERAQERLEGHVDIEDVAREFSGHLSRRSSSAYALRDFDSRSWLEEIDVPTAVLLTVEDDRIPVHQQRELTERLRGPHVFEVPDPTRHASPGPPISCPRWSPPVRRSPISTRQWTRPRSANRDRVDHGLHRARELRRFDAGQRIAIGLITACTEPANFVRFDVDQRIAIGLDHGLHRAARRRPLRRGSANRDRVDHGCTEPARRRPLRRGSANRDRVDHGLHRTDEARLSQYEQEFIGAVRGELAVFMFSSR